MSIKNYFYGPVPSRRLGFSLGVDLLPKKTCSFNCLYCQLGPSSKKTAKRFFSLNLSKFKEDLKEIISKGPKINYITISGSGEPTLHKGLDKVIAAIRIITQNKYPVAVITNSSLLYKREVRDELGKADLIVPSLDAATEKTFSKINRPAKGITLKRIVSGLISLRKEFKGKIWLEIMLISGINDSKREIEKFREIIDKINPDKIQLNLPVRPAGVNPVRSIKGKGKKNKTSNEVKIPLPSRKKVEGIKRVFGKTARVVVKFSLKKRGGKAYGNLKRDIFNFLKVRPATLEDLTRSLTANPNEIVKQLSLLLEEKKIKLSRIRGVKYFVTND